MTSVSPFAPDRYEYEPRHLYHLPKAVFNVLEGSTQIYVVGSRGTGKTTLMKALYWEERLSNETLQRALGCDLFDRHYLGVYIKVPDTLVATFERWSRDIPEDVRSQLFGLLIDLAWIDSVLLGVSELSRRKVIKAKPATEHKEVDQIVLEHPEVGPFLPSVGPYSFVTLARATREMRAQFERYINCGLDYKDLLGRFRISQVGSFGRSITSRLASFCDQASHGGAKWYFKVCMDEAECFSEFQQRAINTMIRLAKWPLFYIVSFVSVVGDFRTTVIPKLTLQKADRLVVVLDSMTDIEFRELAEGVATVRVRDYLNREDLVFDGKRIFGRLSINALLAEILRESEAPKAKDLLTKAKDLKTSDFFQQGADAGEDHDAKDTKEPLPIYEAYIVDRLNIQMPKSDEPSWKRRSQQSGEIRKRMVAAYLAICEELGREVKYASADMILQMSDKCIRDFLAQISSIFTESGKPVVDFVNSKISASKQDKAIKRASREKIDNLPKSGVTAPSEVFRLVDGLGKVTARIQKEELSKRVLSSSERGIFVVDTSEHLMRESPLFDVLREASEAGYLRLLTDDDKKWKFRMHCSLAAAYGFSYRGAYYETPVGLIDLERLRTAENKEALEKAVNILSERLVGLPMESLTLFD